MKHIVWAVDGSDCAWRAGDFARDLMEKWPDVKLTAVFVHVPAVPTSEWTAEYAVQMEREAQKLAGELKHEVERRFASFGPRVEFRVEHGSPAERIVHAADEVGADLVILGSHGKNAVDRLLHGQCQHGGDAPGEAGCVGGAVKRGGCASGLIPRVPCAGAAGWARRARNDVWFQHGRRHPAAELHVQTLMDFRKGFG